MKKTLALLMVLCMVFSFVACSESKVEKQLDEATDAMQDALENGDSDDISSAIDDAADALDGAADEIVDAGQTINLNAEAVAKELMNDAEYKTTAEQFKAQGLLYTIEARDNYLAYVYQYTIDIGDTSAVKANSDAQIDTLKSVADSALKVFTGLDGIIFEYLDYNGDIIATYKFN